MGLAANHEGRQVADWFTSRGVTAFALKYRLGQKYLYPIPLTTECELSARQYNNGYWRAESSQLTRL
jgi:hypothetical protein